jgi:hypothetical protein
MGLNSVDRENPIDTCEIREVEDPVLGKRWEYDCEKYEVGARVKDSGEAFFPDFGLGWMVRQIQATVRATFDDSYRYVKSCNRVEDMFLGRCSGNPEGEEEPTHTCSPEGFANIKGIPPIDGIPQQAKDYFLSEIGTKLTAEHIAAYAQAEEATGIPCAVIAGIHWTEGGMNLEQSVFDGGSLRGESLGEDATMAMEHLKTKFIGGFDPNNIDYEKLAEAVSYYNGVGNNNCDFDTRWKNGGKCPRQFVGDDHPHPMNWISSRHTNMDLIYCLDFVQFSCNIKWNEASEKALREHLIEKARMGYAPDIEYLVANAHKCYEGSPLCQSYGAGKYIRYERPGSLTVAILLNAASLNK